MITFQITTIDNQPLNKLQIAQITPIENATTNWNRRST